MKLFAWYVAAVAFFNYHLISGSALTRPPWLLGIALVAVAVAQTWRDGTIPRPGAFGLALLVFFATTILNGFVVSQRVPDGMPAYLRSEFQFALVLGVVFAFARARLRAPQVARLAKVWVWTAGAAAAYAIYQTFARVLGLPLPELAVVIKGFSGLVVKEFYGFFAASSWFAEPSWLGSYLLVPLVYVTGLLVLDPPRPFRLPGRWAAVLAGLMLVALFMSLSQAAYATLAVVAIPMLWVIRDRIRLGRALRVAAVAGIVVLAAAGVLSRRGADVIRAQVVRLVSLATSWRSPETAWQITSYGPRMTNMRAAFALWSTRPVVGVGINTVPYHRDAGRLLWAPHVGSVDSGLLQVLVEQGILGFGALLAALAILWERLTRARARARDPGYEFLLWFLMWGLVTDVVNSMVTHPWQHPQRWLVISLAASWLASADHQVPAADRSPASEPRSDPT